MNFLKKGLLFTGLVLVSSCVSYIHTETRPIEEPGNIDGSSTYQWSDFNLSIMAPSEQISSTFSEEIKQEVNRSLVALGYSETQDKPDFYIDAALTLTREESERIETNILYDHEDYL